MIASYGKGNKRTRTSHIDSLCNAFVVEGYPCLPTFRVLDVYSGNLYTNIPSFKRVWRLYTK